MNNVLSQFETIVRSTRAAADSAKQELQSLHPFDERNIHPEIAKTSQKLFDNGHYSQATFEAFKYVDKYVGKLSGITKESGYKLMMSAFDENNPKILLTPNSTTSDKDEQLGFRFMFAGASSGIRNPRGHDVNLPDTIDLCLDHLSVASVLLRRLEQRISPV